MPKKSAAVVGGGIVGLATARALRERWPDLHITLFEKEETVAQHQTSHNSGVLHSGIYYKPGSLRALNCRDGRAAMVRFCIEHEIPYEICGKVIVATAEEERPRLRTIYERGVANGVDCRLIDAAELADLEPHARGVEAIHVPDAGIVDYYRVARTLASLVAEQGVEVRTGARVIGIRDRADGVEVRTEDDRAEVDFVVTCGGLQSDRLAAMSNPESDVRIVPFRGEYYTLHPRARHLCRNLIYPVPDPAFPFLGVHFTRMINGGVECGPNAVLSLAREGYQRGSIDFRDLFESLTYSGFLRLAGRNWKAGLGEIYRSLSKGAFARALQRLVPEIREEDLCPAPAGIRAQALDRSGALVDDFLFVESARVINVCNAPSPAATASLNIGRLIADKMAARLN